MKNAARPVSVALTLFAATPLFGQPTQSVAQDDCPAEPDSDFCQFYERYAAQERTRQRVVAAARRQGMEDPSGWIQVRRDSAGTLTIDKVGLELPEKVEARLNGYLTPLAMKHCREPGVSVNVNLNLEPPIPHPHPDSASRKPGLVNLQEVYRNVRRHRKSTELKSAVGRDGEVVVLHLLVDATGKVREIKVVRSSEEEEREIVDTYAAWIVSKMKFKPCKHYGAPMACWVEQPIRL